MKVRLGLNKNFQLINNELVFFSNKTEYNLHSGYVADVVESGTMLKVQLKQDNNCIICCKEKSKKHFYKIENVSGQIRHHLVAKETSKEKWTLIKSNSTRKEFNNYLKSL